MAHTGDPNFVRYGVPVKFHHTSTGFALHSHNIQYKSGSKQQEVTCFEARDDNDWWIVKGPHSSNKYNCQLGAEVLNGQILRLEHLLTEKNLHSHAKNKSPSSNQGEVTCFGNHGIGDDNDNWRLMIEGAEPNEPWNVNHRFRLIHITTNYALHSHHGHSTKSKQQEVTGFTGRDDNDLWQVETFA